MLKKFARALGEKYKRVKTGSCFGSEFNRHNCDALDIFVSIYDISVQELISKSIFFHVVIILLIIQAKHINETAYLSSPHLQHIAQEFNKGFFSLSLY
jgi:hypothetical protein